MLVRFLQFCSFRAQNKNMFVQYCWYSPLPQQLVGILQRWPPLWASWAEDLWGLEPPLPLPLSPSPLPIPPPPPPPPPLSPEPQRIPSLYLYFSRLWSKLGGKEEEKWRKHFKRKIQKKLNVVGLPTSVKGTVSRDVFFFEGPNNQQQYCLNERWWFSQFLAVVLWRKSKIKFLYASMRSLTINCENPSSNPL